MKNIKNMNNLSRFFNHKEQNNIFKPNFNNVFKESYIVVDSSKRQKETINNYDKLYNLQPYALSFTNNSSIIKINMPFHNFKIGDYLSVNNIVSKMVFLNNVISVKKNSKYMRINHMGHGLSLYGKFNPDNNTEFKKVEYIDKLPTNYLENDIIPDINNNLYILKKSKNILQISLSGICGNNYNRDFIGNIPVNFLNTSLHDVYLIFREENGKFQHDPDNYLIKLDKKSSINYSDNLNFLKDINDNNTTNKSTNTICVKFYNIYGIPLSLFNPSNYFEVMLTDNNSFSIDIEHKAIVDPNYSFYNFSDIQCDNCNYNEIINNNMGGGPMPYVRKITQQITGYPNPNKYIYKLDRDYKNIISAQIISATFPNFQKEITENNNKLYWRNLDNKHIYNISIEPGNYSPQNLVDVIQQKLNSVINIKYCRNKINPLNKYDKYGNYKYHIFNVDINSNIDQVIFSSYKEIELNSNNTIINIPNKIIQLNLSNNLLNVFKKCNNIFALFSEESVNCYTKNNLYKLLSSTNYSVGKLKLNKKILINYKNIILSSNTTTLFNNFNYTIDVINLLNHNLSIGDIIITDKIINKYTQNNYIYEICEILDSNNIKIKKCTPNNFIFILNNEIINISMDDNINKLIENENIIINEKHTINYNDIMIINHPNHEFEENTQIIISNSHSINNVPFFIINKKHNIHKVLNKDQYLIYLDNYDPINSQNKTDFYSIRIKYPNKFQLLFTHDDTLGNVLNFNTNNNTLITPYKNIISNKDNSGEKKIGMNQFSYFYITCQNFKCFDNTKPVDNVFGIIKLTDTTRNNKYLDESFISGEKIFETPLNSLNELDIEMKYPNNDLVEFNNMDHMFVIKLIEINSQPFNVNISGKSNLQFIN
ncbi:hypothetical protein H012_gp597 [Acanthamoeba polyphaga moumouvirus]|uniref:Uncharacterized protein n=1 Tax=Acanthamoeba polyphaga moumouvirus TaxID=1269028 RepID=L7RCB0_9VIRU|nr:hypothetical protein H012_gp597 [Acanthamoeba polyphaga moumouvirus]AGC01866.1 hypothetical protein Moumou_00326 [Acanthamoeba polyphaga moumouvirus]